jgi:poly(A) polymerase
VIPQRLEGLVAATADLAERFAAAGKNLYLVGGVVRDAIVNRLADSDDLDFTTDALPDETEQILKGWADALWTQGKRFGTIGAKKDGRSYEITTHRAEAYHPDSRKPEVTFSSAVEADLARRDFTVNALALKLPGTEIIDPFDGLIDLAQGRLRTPLSPEESFSDDPLRMLRAARFIAGFSLVPDEALVTAVKEMAPRLSIVSAERVRDEFNKLLVLDDPAPGLWFVCETGLADQFLPELPAMRVEQDPIHRHKDVLAHTIAVVGNTEPDLILRMSALLHDIGKPATRRFADNGVSFHHHEVVGARMARKRLDELKWPTDDRDDVVTLVELHLRFHTYAMGWTDSAIRRYVRDAGPLLERLNKLTRADCTTRNEAKAKRLADRMDKLESEIARLRAQEELDAIRPDIDGEQVMKHLGIPPSRTVGEALAFLLEIRLDEGPIGEEEAFRRLDAWWAARS